MLVFKRGTAVLLTWSLLAVASVVSAERVTTCDDGYNVHRLECDDGVIKVESALYGRSNRETCSEGRPPQQLINTECSQEGTLHFILKRCNGKKMCEINTNDVRISDPCPGTFKYLETKFACVRATHFFACEDSYAHLTCDKGQVIFVHGADYGRRESTICSYRRSASQIGNVYCSNPTTKVGEICNGRNSCTIKASNSVFGDPCVGTYKYLEVGYACEKALLTAGSSS